MSQNLASPSAIAAVAPQADLLLQRLVDLEGRLGVQEWWLLGRDFEEARVLAEIASLLAVARAELDQMLVDYCGRAPTELPPARDEAEDPVGGADPAYLAQQRALSQQLLQTLAVALPPTSIFARQLHPFAARNGMPQSAVDILGIVADRVEEAQETLRTLGQ